MWLSKSKGNPFFVALTFAWRIKSCARCSRRCLIAYSLRCSLRADDSCGGDLLPEDNGWPASVNELEPCWPEVSFISVSTSFSSGGEGLAGTASGPHWGVVRDSCKPQCVRPAADSGKEVALDEASEIGGSDVEDRAFIYFSEGDESHADEFAEPRRRLRVELVVVGATAQRSFNVMSTALGA